MKPEYPNDARRTMPKSEFQPAILQIIPQLETGGAEQTTLDIAAALTDKGWRSIVVSQGGRMVEELVSSGAKHIQLPAKSKNPLTIIRNAFRLAKIIERENISLIHARSRAPAWSAMMAARICGIPFVTTYHGAYSQKSWVKGLYNSSMTRSDIIIANSHWTANLIRSRNNRVGEKIEVIHRGTDLSTFDRKAIAMDRMQSLRKLWDVADEQKILLNLARLTGWKGQKTLIEAMPSVLEEFPDFVLVLAGDDQGRDHYRHELEQRISEFNINKNVRITGHCNDPAAACALSDLVVVASHLPEAFGRAAVEAQALQTPVIVTDIGAAGETVLAPPQVEENARTGWRIPPNDTNAMAAAILSVLKLDDDEKMEILHRARDHVQSNFSLDNMCDKTLKVYSRLFK